MRRWIGRVLVFIGVIYLILSFLVMTGLGSLYYQSGKEITDKISRIGIISPFITGAAILLIGLILIEGKKRTILFLRPFNSPSNDLIIKILERKLGIKYRIIALDDNIIRTPKFSLIDSFVAVIFFVPAGLLLFFIAAIAMPLSNENKSIVQYFPTMISIWTGLFFLKHSVNALFPAFKRNKYKITNSKTLSVNLRRVASLSTWGLRVFAPKSLVLKTSPDMWKSAVEKIGNKTDFAIIDISRISENIEWEINYLKKNKQSKYIVIADKNHSSATLNEEFSIEYYDNNSKQFDNFEDRINVKLEEFCNSISSQHNPHWRKSVGKA